MSEAINDDMLLNDDNDEDLDYDLDPNEEHALLEEESDTVEQDFEEDVLDLNEDYDQMDVNDDKALAKVNNESKVSVNNENKNTQIKIQTSKNQKGTTLKKIVKGLRRGNNRNRNSYPLRRSKTVLINPRFKGPVHVNSNQFAWDSPACNNTYDPQRNQQFIQPWVTGNVQNHFPPPVNTYAPTPFVPPNQGNFLPPQINTNYIPPLQQSISPFLQPQPVPNQHLLLNQPVMQLNPCPNQFHFQGPPQVPIIQQFPEQQKLPVHQRLGIPSTAPQPNVLIQPPNNQTHFNGNQNLQPINNFVISQNFNQNQMPNNQHNNFQHKRPELFQHSNSKSFHSNQQYRKNGNNFKNNNKIVSVRKNNFNNNKREIATEKLEVGKDTQEEKNEKKDTCVAEIPEDEDEETREYRKKIEEQKRKREEILRKKEESRRKNLALETPQIVTKPNNRPFQQKKFNFSHNQHPQQNKQHKIHNYTNNIVITGNDHHQFGQRNNTLVPINNFAQPNRIIVPNNIQTDQVKSEDISSFLSTRSVITQDNLSQTNIVVVKNLALATNETKIMKLCRDIGQVQKLQMEKNEHQATIHFNTVASAHAFYNKFRRRMIDLSMVQVDLVPFDNP